LIESIHAFAVVKEKSRLRALLDHFSVVDGPRARVK
jgi:hypothetical protein